MKKILIINLLLIILLNSFYVCFATENETELIKHVGECPLYLKYKGVFKAVHYAAYEKDGKENPAYCLNPEFGGVGSDGRNEYAVNINEKITNENIWKVIRNGYPYKSLKELGVENKEEAYTATQLAVYTVLDNRNIEDYTPDETPAGRRTLAAYLKIMEDAKTSTETMNVNIEIIPITTNWEIDENEIDCLSKTFSLKSNNLNGAYTISFYGENIEKFKITDENGNEKNTFLLNEKFKILVPIESLVNDINLEIEIKAKLNTYPILFGKTTISETQNYALTGESEQEFEIICKEIIPKNISTIKIIKQEAGTNKRLEGVKFNLLNSNKDSVIQDLITDKNGEITLEGLFPGVYYLQEIETLEDYYLNTEAIEINLKLNEEVEVIVDNSIKEKIEESAEKEIPIENSENETTDVLQENSIIVPVKTLPVTGY